MQKDVLNQIKDDINLCLNKKCTECSYWNNGVRCDKRKLLSVALETINALDATVDKATDTLTKMEDRLQTLHSENQALSDENTALKDNLKEQTKKFNHIIRFVKATNKKPYRKR